MSDGQDNNLNVEAAAIEGDSPVIDNLLAGDFPGVEAPVEEVITAKDGEGEEADKPKEEGVADAGGEGEGSAPVDKPLVPEVKVYKYRGKEYTVEQMVELGVLEDALTSAEQLPHLQTKYLETLETIKGGAAKTEDAAAPAAGPTPAELQNHYAAEIKKVAEAGYLDPDFADAFPASAASMIFHRDLLYDVRNAVAQLLQQNKVTAKKTEGEQANQLINGLCDKVAGDGDYYTTLGDGDARGKFIEYLVELNPFMSQINESFIRRQWIAFNGDTVLAAVSGANVKAAAKSADKRRLAAGEGGAPRNAANNEPAHEPGDIIDSLIAGEFPTGG
jgi:hypothetical protein